MSLVSFGEQIETPSADSRASRHLQQDGYFGIPVAAIKRQVCRGTATISLEIRDQSGLVLKDGSGILDRTISFVHFRARKADHNGYVFSTLD